MNEITVYGKPGCVQCLATTRHLIKMALPYTYVDVTVDEQGRDTVSMLGYLALPVVTVGDAHWSGYRHDRLVRLGQIWGTAPDITVLEADAVAYLADGASA